MEARTAHDIVFTSSPASVDAITSFRVTVAVRDQFGAADSSFRGTVRLSSSDPLAAVPGSYLPIDYTFTAADAGVHSFDLILHTAGTQALTVTGLGQYSSLTATQLEQISSLRAQDLLISGPGVWTGTYPDSVTLTAADGYGNPDLAFRGTVHFTSNDTSAALPADYTFTAADRGRHVFPFTFVTPGARTLTATVPSLLHGTATLNATVNEVPVVDFQISAPASVVAGTAPTITVRAVDQYGNPAGTFRGSGIVIISSATLNQYVDFTAADAGVASSRTQWP